MENSNYVELAYGPPENDFRTDFALSFLISCSKLLLWSLNEFWTLFTFSKSFNFFLNSSFCNKKKKDMWTSLKLNAFFASYLSSQLYAYLLIHIILIAQFLEFLFALLNCRRQSSILMLQTIRTQLSTF